MTILPKEQLLKKNIKNLLYILKKVRPLVFRVGRCSCGSGGCDYDVVKSDPDGNYDKYYKEIKAILATREHVK